MSIRSTIGFADLANAVRHLDPDETSLDLIAATLGFKRKIAEGFPTEANANGIGPLGFEKTDEYSEELPQTRQTHDGKSVEIDTVNAPRGSTFIPKTIRTASPLPDWDDALPPTTDLHSLVPRRLARSFILEKLAQPIFHDELDLEALIDQIAKGSLPTFSRLRRKGLRNGVQMLVDHGAAMQPFRTDTRDLRNRIRKVVGPSWLGELFFQGLPDQVAESEFRWRTKEYQPPHPGTTVLVVTDLGIGQPYGSVAANWQQWHSFLRRLTLAGCLVIVLLPYGRKRWPRIPKAGFKLEYWGTHLALGTGDFRDLARLLAAGTTLDRSLIREARRKYFPDAEVGIEADLLLSPLIGVSNARLIALRAEVLRLLRAELIARPGETERAVRFLSDYRRTYGTTERVSFEESLVSAVLRGSTQEFEGLVSSMIRSLIEEPDTQLARCALTLANQLPEVAFADPLVQQLHAAAALRVGIVPSDLKGILEEHPWLLPADTEIEVEWANGELILHDPPVGSGELIKAPSTLPRHLFIKPETGPIKQVQVWPGEPCILPIDIPAELVTLSGATYRLRTRAKAAVAPIQITATGLMNSRFEFMIVREGRDAPAELTYDLNDPAPSRRLLRLREQDALLLFKELPANRQFQKFRDLVRDLRSRTLGNIQIAKAMVVEQYDSGLKDQEYGIAVHKLGPVPVFLLPETLTGELETLNINGLKINPRIGIFPSLSGRGTSTQSAYKQDLLRSYNIRLDIVLRKYLEDVGAHFHDIENYLPRRDVLRRAQQVESILKQSIAGKTELILQYLEANTDLDLHSLALNVWESFSESIMTAALARVFALYLLNELYRIIGVADRSDKYNQEWNRILEPLADLRIGTPYDDELFVPGSELFLLRDARSQYVAEGHDRHFDRLQQEAEARGIKWVQDFIGFARFVAGLRRESPSAGTFGLFVSYPQSSPVAAGFFQSIKEYTETQTLPTGQPGLEVLAVGREDPGTDVEQLIKLRIWLSDLVLAVIPKSFESILGEPSDLNRMVREMDHAILLQRLTRVLLEEGTDRERLLKVFEADIDPIAPTHDRFDHRQRKDHRVARLHKNTIFSYISSLELSRAMEGRIDQLILETRERHSRDVMIGFLGQFDNPEMLLKILEVTNFPRTKKWICDQLANQRRTVLQQRLSSNVGVKEKQRRSVSIEKDIAKYRKRVRMEFDRIRTATANRGLVIDGQQWFLLAEAGPGSKRTYRSNLRSILNALMPEADDKHLKIMHERLFALVPERRRGRSIA